MADSSIEWTNATWNPTVGCMKVSAGCEHCYAMTLAHRLPAMGQTAYEGLTRKLPDGSVNWTGKVRMLPERLELPLKWRKPRMIFVDSMSDLFHEDVPDNFIAAVFAVMETAQRHTFQILTKRPARMARLLSNPQFYAGFVRKFGYDALGSQYDANNPGWPLPNVWLGTSVENQVAADERVPLLLQTPAAIRFLSCEPLLGPLDILDWLANVRHCAHCDRSNTHRPHPSCIVERRRIDWLIAGGESGPNYRAMDLAWIRSLRDQCKAAGVAFFAKQNSGPRTHMWLPEDLQSHEFPEPAREVVHA